MGTDLEENRRHVTWNLLESPVEQDRAPDVAPPVVRRKFLALCQRARDRGQQGHPGFSGRQTIQGSQEIAADPVHLATMIGDFRLQFLTEEPSSIHFSLQPVDLRRLPGYGHGNRAVDRGDGQAVAEGFDKRFRLLRRNAHRQHLALALQRFLKPAALVDDTYALFQGKRARDAGAGDFPDAVADDVLRFDAKGPPPGRQGPLQRHVGGLGDFDVGDSFSGRAVPHPFDNGAARNPREQMVERVQRRAERGRRIVECAPHAVVLRTHAGEDKDNGRRFRADPCRFETIRDTAATERLEPPGGFVGLFKDQRQAVIEMGPVQGERCCQVGRMRIGMTSQPGCRIRCLLPERGGAASGQDQEPGSALAGRASGIARLDHSRIASRPRLYAMPGGPGNRRGPQHHVGVGAAESEGVYAGV